MPAAELVDDKFEMIASVSGQLSLSTMITSEQALAGDRRMACHPICE